MRNCFIQSLQASSLSYVCLMFTLILSSTVLAEQNKIYSQLHKLEEDYQFILTEFYRDKASYSVESMQYISSVDLLHSEILWRISSKQPVTAIRLIYFNIQTVKNNLKHKAIGAFIRLLLENNDLKLADALLRDVIKKGDKNLLPEIYFHFSRYYAQRHNWSKVNNLLEKNINKLSLAKKDNALLLNGVALIYLKKYKLAKESLTKILPSSHNYAYAQLNTVIANIKLGLWNEEDKAIDDIINKVLAEQGGEVVNRLYLLLGYALMQQKNNAKARNAFRRISLGSRYTNRALVGIGLTAISQKDFSGALNALSILKNKKIIDLSVDESYILFSYLYENQFQEYKMSTSYMQAMKYYQSRIDQLEVISTQKNDISVINYDESASAIIINNVSFDYKANYPESFMFNYKQLNNLLKLSRTKSLKNKIEKLIKKYVKMLQKITSYLARQRKEYLVSYLNQSRYGLAHLYDNSIGEAN